MREQHGNIPLVILRPAGIYDDQCHATFLAHHNARIHQRQMTSHVYPGDLQADQRLLHLDDLCDAVRHVDAIRRLLPGAAGFANWMQVAGGDLTSLHEGVWNIFCDHLAKQGRLHGTKRQHSIYWRGAKQLTEFLRAQHGIVATKAALAPP